MNEERISKAQRYAHSAHDAIGQKCKYTGEPYWVHTDAVANLVRENGGDEEMIMAAHLHDVLEDVTPELPSTYNSDEIRKLFGQEVLNLVVELTDEFTKKAYPQLNRATRHGHENSRLYKISDRAKLVKIMDLIHNTHSINEFDPDFARVYLHEKEEVLPLLRTPFTENAYRIAYEQLKKS